MTSITWFQQFSTCIGGPHILTIKGPLGSKDIPDFKAQFSVLPVSVLDVNAFERLLGPCMEIMKRNIDDYEDQLVRIFGSKAHISDIRWKQ